MSDAWIVAGKLLPPAAPAGSAQRARLAPASGATMLVAGPGYGKTVALAGMLEAAAAEGVLTVWYALDPFDADPATFFHYLVAGMQRHIPQFGLEVRAALQSDQLDPAVLWKRFFQAIASFRAPALLVLDDAHHLADDAPELLKALAYWLDKLPPGLRIALASRKRLPMPTARLEMTGALTLLGPEALRFTDEEAAAFMAQRAEGRAVPGAWREAAERLDGWPLGLDATCQVGREAGAHAPRLADYIAEELYGAQSPALRRFMLQAALWPELSAEAIAPWAPDAQASLRALEAEHLIHAIGDGTAYRFPGHLREFLLAEGERAVSAAERAGWHAQAASHARAAGQFERALPHLAASENWAGLMAACAEAFPAMRHDGRQSTLRRWLAVFPADVALADPTWQLWQGHAKSREGRPAEAIAAYDRARKGFEAAGDPTGAFKAAVAQANMALLQEDAKRFGPLLMQALALQADGLAEDQADLLLVRALSAEQRGDMALMRECNEGVMALDDARNVELAASRCIAAMNLYTFRLHQGALAHAHTAIDQVVAIAESHGFVPYALFAAFLKAHLHLMAGEPDAAAALLKPLPEAWPELLDWHARGCAEVTAGFLHQARGEWKDAESTLKRSLATFEAAGFKEGAKLPLERLAWVAIQRGAPAEALGWVSRAGLDESDPGARNVYDLALRLAEARALALTGQLDTALGRHAAIAEAAEAADARLHLARARFYEAAARLGSGDRDGAATALAEGRRLVEAEDFGFLLSQDRALWEELAGLSAPVATSAAPAVMAPAPTESTMELRVFGGLEVRLDGVAVDRWPRRKAKLVLAALALHPAGLKSAELADVLGDGLEEATASTVKVAVLSLRRTLEPALEKGEASAFVRLEGDRYRLAWDRIGSLDLRAFEEAADAGDAKRQGDPATAAEAYGRAIAVYRDNLLDESFFTGHFEAERERLRERALEMAAWVAEWHGDRGDAARAEAMWVRRVAIAPLDEGASLALMRHYQAHGRPERVKQVYWDYCRTSKTLLDAPPSESFVRAYQAL